LVVTASLVLLALSLSSLALIKRLLAVSRRSGLLIDIGEERLARLRRETLSAENRRASG
jgi:hypothetical protein